MIGNPKTPSKLHEELRMVRKHLRLKEGKMQYFMKLHSASLLCQEYVRKHFFA